MAENTEQKVYKVVNKTVMCKMLSLIPILHGLSAPQGHFSSTTTLTLVAYLVSPSQSIEILSPTNNQANTDNSS